MWEVRTKFVNKETNDKLSVAQLFNVITQKCKQGFNSALLERNQSGYSESLNSN